MNKFKASKTIVKESWAILMQDKEILWFPVATVFACLVALVILAPVYFFVIFGGHIAGIKEVSENGTDIISYIVYLVSYFVIFFIVNFFQAGIYTIVYGRFHGENLTFRDGIKGATKNIGKIFVWSLISATVGLIFKIIADRSKLAGKIIAGLLGAAWNIMTYFSLPSLVIGGKGVTDSFKESASVIKKTWGETIIINFGVGIVFGLLNLVAIALAIGLFVLYPTITAGIILGVLLVLYIIVLAVISSTLTSIFKLALYEYARTGIVPQGFSVALIAETITKKS